MNCLKKMIKLIFLLVEKRQRLAPETRSHRWTGPSTYEMGALMGAARAEPPTTPAREWPAQYFSMMSVSPAGRGSRHPDPGPLQTLGDHSPVGVRRQSGSCTGVSLVPVPELV